VPVLLWRGQRLFGRREDVFLLFPVPTRRGGPRKGSCPLPPFPSLFGEVPIDAPPLVMARHRVAFLFLVGLVDKSSERKSRQFLPFPFPLSIAHLISWRRLNEGSPASMTYSARFTGDVEEKRPFFFPFFFSERIAPDLADRAVGLNSRAWKRSSPPSSEREGSSFP